MFNFLQPHGLYSPWNSPGQNTGVGSCFLLQGIFPTQGSSPGLPHCRRILYQLSHKGSPRILEWVACPFASGSSKPRNWTGVSCIAGGSFTSRAIRESAFKAGLADTGLSLQGQLFSTETSLLTLNCFIQHLAHSWHSNICYKYHNIHNQKMQRVNILKRRLSYLNSFQPRRIEKETLTRCSLFFFLDCSENVLSLWSHHICG